MTALKPVDGPDHKALDLYVVGGDDDLDCTLVKTAGQGVVAHSLGLDGE